MRPGPSAFTWEPLFVALVVVAAVAYARAVRHERPPIHRIILFALGLVLIVAALASPLETIARHYLLVIHLLGNVMIADWAPPLLVLGLTPAMRARLAPPLARVSRPWIALPVWLAVWYLVHLPSFYDYALRHTWALNVEHLLLIAAGLLFWWTLFGAGLSTPAALVYLFVALIGSMFLGLAFMFSSNAFYSFYEHAPRLWGLSPQKDQNLGGILMNAEQTAVFLAALAYFLLRLLNEEHAEAAEAAHQKRGAASLSSDR
jgi:cytochrome c oxidase assembly factor CtaG